MASRTSRSRVATAATAPSRATKARASHAQRREVSSVQKRDESTSQRLRGGARTATPSSDAPAVEPWNASLDAKLLRLVLEHKPHAAPWGTTLQTWDAITVAFNKGRDHRRTLESGRHRLVYRVQLLWKHFDKQRARLGAEVVELLETLEKESARKPLEEEEVETLELQVDRRGRPLVDLSPAELEVPRFRCVRPRQDEALLRLLLERRPYYVQNDFRLQVLADQVVRELGKKGTMTSSEYVYARVEWLVAVWQDPDHPEHRRLTPTLVEMLTEYAALSNRRLVGILEAHACETYDDILVDELIRRAPVEKSISWDDVAKTLNERLGANVFVSGESCDRRVSLLREQVARPREEAYFHVSTNLNAKLMELETLMARGEDGDAALGDGLSWKAKSEQGTGPSPDDVQPALIPGRSQRDQLHDPFGGGDNHGDTSRFDEILLRLVVDLQPHTADEDSQHAAWNRVAVAFYQEAGLANRATNADGARMRARVEDLQAAFEKSNGARTRKRSAMVEKLLAKLRRSKQSQKSSRRTVSLSGSSLRGQKRRRETQQDEDDEESSLEYGNKSRNNAPHRDDMMDSGVSISALQRFASGARAEADRMQKRIETLEATIFRDRTEAREQIDNLRRRIEGIQPGTSVEHGISSADPAQSLATILHALQQERQEHRAEVATLVELLRDEREANRRDTKALLEAMNKERQDRRDEFVALMKNIPQPE